MDEKIRGNPLPWLLEPDPVNPAVRYFTLRDVLDHSEDELEVLQARADVMRTGPVPAILSAQHPEGYWFKPGNGYSPKYLGTVWQIIFLAELGADPYDDRVQKGCEYLLDHGLASNGAFSYNRPPVPSGAVHCLNGNLLYALLNLDRAGDLRVQTVLDWQARAISGEGDISYYKSGTPGPGFACAINLGQPCGWGATKSLKALSAVSPTQRTPLIQRAIDTGVEFLLSHDPSVADYPYTERVSSTWFKFGFPLSYWSDVLEIAEVLVKLGYGSDVRLDNTFRYILSKQDDQGRWKMENNPYGKMWVDIEKKGQPSKWVTLRALRVLRQNGCISF